VVELNCWQSRNHAAGIQRKDAKWQRRQAGKANSQYESIGAGDNQTVTSKLGPEI